jgi:hypothetical protein
MGPLDKARAQEAANAAVAAEPDDQEASEDAYKAYIEGLEDVPASQRLLSEQGKGEDLFEGLLNAVLCAPPKPRGPAFSLNPLLALTPLAHILTNNGRMAILAERGDQFPSMYLPTQKDFIDPLDGPIDKPVPASAYFFALLAAAHWLKMRSRVRNAGKKKPEFAAKEFPALPRLWQAVHDWHRRLVPDLGAVGLKPRGGDQLASWGFVEVPEDAVEDAKAAFFIDPQSPPPQNKRRRRG